MTRFIAGRIFATFTLASIVLTTACVTLPSNGNKGDRDPGASLIVRTQDGKLRGEQVGTVQQFLGIPFAAPPVGALRWRPPQPVKPWDGIRDATAFGPDPMQPSSGTEAVSMQRSTAPGPHPAADPTRLLRRAKALAREKSVPFSEDCLYLNVYRPATPSDKPLPVLFWIFGGGLVTGGASLYPGGPLAEQGIIVVTTNYRLGRIGYFAHPAIANTFPGELYGNYGYMDQLAALQWVRDNIAAFGGDPNNVTIAGESAGAGSVLVHLTSPLSQGLFHRAIMESAGIPASRAAATPMCSHAKAQSIAVTYAMALGIDGFDANTVTALQALPADVLVEGLDQYVVEVLGGPPIPGLSNSIMDGAQVVAAPQAMIEAGLAANVPVLLGANSMDLAWSAAATKQALFAMFGLQQRQAQQLYDPTGAMPWQELVQEVIADELMVEPSRHLAEQVTRSGQPAYWYRFSYVPVAYRSIFPGAPHAWELPFVFDSPGAIFGLEVRPEDIAMAKVVSAYWVSFVKTGDPNHADAPVWPPFDPRTKQVFNFTDTGVGYGPDPIAERLDFWQQFWPTQEPGTISGATAMDRAPIEKEKRSSLARVDND